MSVSMESGAVFWQTGNVFWAGLQEGRGHEVLRAVKRTFSFAQMGSEAKSGE